MKDTLIFSIILVLVTSLNPCEPFGLRLNYGRSIYDPQSPQRLGIRFNTRQECPQVELLINKFMIVHCPTKELTYRLRDFSQTGQQYKAFLHSCSLTRQVEFDTEIEYNLFDVDTSRKIFKGNIKIKIKNPHNKEAEFRLIHVSDWGPITHPQKREILEPITATLVEKVRQGEVDCAILNGDIGYQLDSSAVHHQETMAMIQEISSLVPIIVNRGNHQDHSSNSTIGTMFQEYFELYDLPINNATGVTLGSLFLAIYDPANMLFPRNYHKFTEKSLSSSLQTTRSLLQKAEKQGKTIIAVSHYPLVCGYPSTGHCIPNSTFGQIVPLYVNLKDFYSLVLKHRVPLVLSGHVHAYERTYPVLEGYRCKDRSNKTNYHFNSSFFIQVVEGVCGSNNGLDDQVKINEEYTPPSFVASHQEFNTGFGVLRASANELKYEHFKLEIGKRAEVFDSFTIHLPEANPQVQTGKKVDQEL